MNKSLLSACCALSLVACAGRSPQPVPVATAYDAEMSCVEAKAELDRNNAKIAELRRGKRGKLAQNISAGVVGLIVWPAWLLMDFQGTANKEIAALERRNLHIAGLAERKCAA